MIGDKTLVDKAVKRQSDRNDAIRWARELLAEPNWVILDTETTGIDNMAEIIQVGVIDSAGRRLMDNLFIKPMLGYIPAAASAVNRITYDMVERSPTFDKVWPQLSAILNRGEVVIYNAAYDVKLIEQTARKYRISVPPYWVSCAMLNNAQYVGDWNEYRQSYKWPKLIGGDHSAVGDCIATLELIKRMAASEMVEVVELI